ncbi:MAG: transglutaminase-like domain-containing protein [Bacteroidales bacterium]
MKYYIILFAFAILTGCTSTNHDYKAFKLKVNNLLSSGEFSRINSIRDSLTSARADAVLLQIADSAVDMAHRIEADFSVTQEIFGEQLKKRGLDSSASDLESWDKNGWIEWRLINGEKKFFNRAASNLYLLKEFNLHRSKRDSALARDEYIRSRNKHTAGIIELSGNRCDTVGPVEMEIIYTVTVEPDVVPEGETIRCWLPFPKENHERQGSVYLSAISNEDFVLAPDTCIHRTIYLENKAEKGKPVVFSIAYNYTSLGQYFNPANIKASPYDKKSPLFRKYTSEQLPQICFTPSVKRLADSIAGNETNPLEICRKIYKWFSGNIPWAGALEYSTMPNIPEYVITNMKGDCGMQTLLLMSMLRYKGIPVKWQSGWMVPPGNKNLHDWCEVYFEGAGWIPLDVSYGLQYSDKQAIREFYITGIDSYRLIVNDGISGRLYPEKKFPRSDPYDFQRGELEWKGGNLYYDTWDYSMVIRYKDSRGNLLKQPKTDR